MRLTGLAIAMRARYIPRLVVAVLLGLAGGSILAQTVNDELLQSTYQRAEQAFREQRLDDAASGFRELAELSPNTAEVHAKPHREMALDGLPARVDAGNRGCDSCRS